MKIILPASNLSVVLSDKTIAILPQNAGRQVRPALVAPPSVTVFIADWIVDRALEFQQ